MKTLLGLVFVLLFLAACGPLPFTATPADTATPPASGNPLAGTQWVLTSLRGEPPLEKTQITIEFQQDIVAGFAGCNSYGGGADNGSYAVKEDGTLEIPELARTAMACLEPEGVMDQEDAYLDALTSATSYSLAGGQLELQNEAGAAILVFVQRQPVFMEPAELAGTAWQLVTMDGKAPLAGSNITLAFHGDGRVSGHAGCRHYVMLYEAGPERISFYFAGMMGLVCEDETLLVQEGDYTTILSWVDRYILANEQLELQSVRGETLAYEPLPAEAQPPLEETTWMLVSFLEPNPADTSSLPAPLPRELLEGTQISLTFTQGQATGDTGCNSYGGSYTLQGEALSVTDLYQTEMACMSPEGVMDQESRYLGILRDATEANVHGTQLWLETADGRGLVFGPER